jgi:membrane protein insertase Oxa1/YidC/SpoIIIJ
VTSSPISGTQVLSMVLSDNSDLFFSFKERIQLETSRLYGQAGVNPLAGILLMNL